MKTPKCATFCRMCLRLPMAMLWIACSDLNPDADTFPKSDSDSLGDTETDTPTEPWTSPVEDNYKGDVDRAEIGDVPFRQDTVLQYRIYMDPALYTEMEEYGDDEMYRPASVEIRGDGVSEDFETIGIRYKGDYSLHHCWDDYGGRRSYSGDCARLSIKLRFDEYNSDARFFGLKRINLHAMSADDVKLRERLAYSVFNDFGVTTARTAHAELIINDEEPMLVLAVEQIDGRYTANRFPDGGDGNLYKETWPGASLRESDLLEQLRTNEDPEDTPDASRFIAFGNAAAAATEASFTEDMAEYTDLTALLRYMAVDRALKNWDGITAFYWQDRPHNLYWYDDVGTTNLFHIIPWDMDKTFDRFDPYMDPEHYNGEIQVPDWNVKPLSCEAIPVWYGTVYVYPSGCDNMINLLAATGWDEFAEIGNELLASAFQYDAMNEKITVWAEQITSLVDEDARITLSSWEARVEDFRSILQKSIDDFAEHLQEGYIVEE